MELPKKKKKNVNTKNHVSSYHPPFHIEWHCNKNKNDMIKRRKGEETYLLSRALPWVAHPPSTLLKALPFSGS
jgi:hypothetical protein